MYVTLAVHILLAPTCEDLSSPALYKLNKDTHVFPLELHRQCEASVFLPDCLDWSSVRLWRTPPLSPPPRPQYINQLISCTPSSPGSLRAPERGSFVPVSTLLLVSRECVCLWGCTHCSPSICFRSAELHRLFSLVAYFLVNNQHSVKSWGSLGPRCVKTDMKSVPTHNAVPVQQGCRSPTSSVINTPHLSPLNRQVALNASSRAEFHQKTWNRCIYLHLSPKRSRVEMWQGQSPHLKLWDVSRACCFV